MVLRKIIQSYVTVKCVQPQKKIIRKGKQGSIINGHCATIFLYSAKISCTFHLSLLGKSPPVLRKIRHKTSVPCTNVFIFFVKLV